SAALSLAASAARMSGSRTQATQPSTACDEPMKSMRRARMSRVWTVTFPVSTEVRSKTFMLVGCTSLRSVDGLRARLGDGLVFLTVVLRFLAGVFFRVVVGRFFVAIYPLFAVCWTICSTHGVSNVRSRFHSWSDRRLKSSVAWRIRTLASAAEMSATSAYQARIWLIVFLPVVVACPGWVTSLQSSHRQISAD